MRGRAEHLSPAKIGRRVENRVIVLRTESSTLAGRVSTGYLFWIGIVFFNGNLSAW